MGDAIKELRVSLVTLLTVTLVWLVTAGAVKGSIERRSEARHLAAWLLVRDRFPTAIPAMSEASVDSTNERTTCFAREIHVQSGTDVEVCDPFTVLNPWNQRGRDTLALERQNQTLSARHIVSSGNALPYAHYAVVSVHDRPYVVPARYLVTERDVYNAVLRDSLAAPEDWHAIRLALAAEGWTGATAQDLRLGDRAVATLVSSGLKASYSVSGIPVSPGFYPSAVSALLGLIAFVLVGPWSVLRAAQALPSDRSWVMLTTATGGIASSLGAVRVVISALVIALPAAVTTTQLALIPRLDRTEAIVLGTTVIGPLACVAMLLAVAIQLARLRRAEMPPSVADVKR